MTLVPATGSLMSAKRHEIEPLEQRKRTLREKRSSADTERALIDARISEIDKKIERVMTATDHSSAPLAAAPDS